MRRLRLLILLLPLLTAGCVIDWVGGSFGEHPEQMPTQMSAEAHTFMDKQLEVFKGQTIMDYHVHVVGLGTGGTGAYVNPTMQSWWHPVKRTQYAVYKSASGIEEEAGADQMYIERLAKLAQYMPGQHKVHLLAFDKHYEPNGDVSESHTEFYIPNDYVMSLVDKHPDQFVPIVSIHPYRKDALKQLEHYAKAGARLIKWLPNAMGIDPSDPMLLPFYEKVKALDMVLLSHTGEEKAVESAEDQALGNPLLLRYPLDLGVKVIAAHCATFGENLDLDHPDRPMTSSFELFMRMFDNPKYEGLLYGELSALVLVNRESHVLETLLARTDLHHRLINGSDYPLPAINVLVSTWELAFNGFISWEERNHLNEVYEYNPLLFDLLLKRSLKHPKSGQGFADGIFTRAID